MVKIFFRISGVNLKMKKYRLKIVIIQSVNKDFFYKNLKLSTIIQVRL